MSMRSQRGFTLIEILVTAAIGGLIMPVLVTSTYQMTRITTSANKEFVIQIDIENASSYFTRDLALGESTDLGGGPNVENHMRVDWIDQTGWAAVGDEAHYAEYTLSGTNLLRNYDGTTTIVARRISDIEFSRVGKYITISITSSLRGKAETLSYFVTARVDEAFE